MTTERDLDTLLATAHGVRDADLPALPTAFLDYLHTSDVRQADVVPASVLAAQQLMQDARDRRGAVGRRSRRPGRRAILAIGVAVLTAAAAWTTAVLVTGSESVAPPGDVPGVDQVALVDFDMPAFPLTLPTAPPGASGPVFGGSGAGGASMSYVGIDDPADTVSINVGTEPLPGSPMSGPDGSVTEEDVTIDGRSARLTVMTLEEQGGGVAYLDWERLPGQWVIINASGQYAERNLLTTIAEDLVDSPQAMPVQLHLAPAGYSLDFFKDDGRIVRLGDDADPEQGLTVHVPLPDEVVPVDQLPGAVAGVTGAVEEVTVQGQPAHLVRTDYGGGRQGCFLQARFPDGTTFIVEAPGTLTQEQVVQIADQVTYTP